MLELCKSLHNPKIKKGLKTLFIFSFLVILSSSIFAEEIPKVIFDNRDVGSNNIPFVILGQEKPLFCSLSGCTMQGDINLNNNSIINGNWINVTFINLTMQLNSTQIINPPWVLKSGDNMTGSLNNTENIYVGGNVTVAERVGIGTANPLVKLDVIGNFSFSEDGKVDGMTLSAGAGGIGNVVLGLDAGRTMESGATRNTLVGKDAGELLTTGDFNTFIGYLAGAKMRIGTGVTAVGDNAGRHQLGSNNAFFGAFAGLGVSGQSTGVNNMGLGTNSLTILKTGNNNMAIGINSLRALEDGDNNAGIGIASGVSLVNGNNNVLIGRSAGGGIVDGDGNVCIGFETGSTIADTSDKLMIDNSNRNDTLIFGDFSERYITINGDLNVNGTTNVTENIYAVGNISSANVFIPQYIFVHTNVTLLVNSANEWTNITFAQENSEIKQGITHDGFSPNNHTFTMSTEGVYSLSFDLDVEDTSASATVIDVAGRFIFINGTEVDGSVFEIDVTRQETEFELSHHILAKFNAGDIVILQFIADDPDVQISTHGSYGEHPDSASIVINKIANKK